MGESYLDIGTLQMDDGIEALGTHTLHEQVLQTVARHETLAVVHDCKACVQIGVVAQHGLNDGRTELIAHEQGVVRFKDDLCSVFFGTGLSLV